MCFLCISESSFAGLFFTFEESQGGGVHVVGSGSGIITQQGGEGLGGVFDFPDFESDRLSPTVSRGWDLVDFTSNFLGSSVSVGVLGADSVTGSIDNLTTGQSRVISGFFVTQKASSNNVEFIVDMSIGFSSGDKYRFSMVAGFDRESLEIDQMVAGQHLEPGLGPDTTEVFGETILTVFAEGTIIDRANDCFPEQAGHRLKIGSDIRDILDGHGGDDRICGKDGFDTIYGLAGSDYLHGNQGNDSIYGGSGDDFLRGGAGVDAIYGGDGNDMLAGDKDLDRLEGGPGNDIYVLFSNHVGPRDMIEDESGADAVWLFESNEPFKPNPISGSTTNISPRSVLYQRSGNHLAIRRANDGTELLQIADFYTSGQVEGFHFENRGTAVAPNRLGALLPNNKPYGEVESVSWTFVSGWAFDPNHTSGQVEVDVHFVPVAGGESTVVTARSGLARVSVADMGFTPVSEVGFEIEVPFLVPGDYEVSAFAFDDRDGATGAVHLPVKALELTRITVRESDPVGIVSGFSGGGGLHGWAFDADLAGAPVSVQFVMSGQVIAEQKASVPLQELVDEGIVDSPNHGFVYGLFSLEFNPEILAGVHDIEVFAVDHPSGRLHRLPNESGLPLIAIAGTQNDDIELEGDARADVIFGFGGDDNIYGMEGNDLLQGNLGMDKIFGGEGDDSIFGGQESDTLRGGAGEDWIKGNVGDDLIYGDSGDDFLEGNEGDDRFFYSRFDGSDTVSDHEGNNELVFEDVLEAEVAQSREGNDHIISLAGSVGGGVVRIDDYYGDGVMTIRFFEPTFGPPVLSDVPDFSIAEDSGSKIIPFTVIHNVLDSSDIEVTASSGGSTIIPQDLIVISGASQARILTISPALNRFGGPIEITLVASDGESEVLQTFQVTVLSVNDGPVARPDLLTEQEDQILSGSVLDDNGGGLDFDVDHPREQLTVSVVETAQHGVLNLRRNGSFEYSPNANFFGEDAFVYRLSDPDGLFREAKVRVVVLSVNDSPIAVDDSFRVAKESVVRGNVLVDNGDGPDSDIDSSTLRIETIPVTGPLFGTLILQSNGDFEYLPNNGFVGRDVFEYRLRDDEAGDDVASVEIEVFGARISPIAKDDLFETVELVPIVGNLLADNGNGEDVDPSGGGLSIAIIGGALHGSVRMTSPLGDIVYSPEAGFIGEDSFEYTITDLNGAVGRASVIIRVTPFEPVMIARDDSFHLANNEMIKGDVLIDNGFGADSFDDLKSPVQWPFDVFVNVLSGPSHGSLEEDFRGGFVYYPSIGFSGEDSFTYQIIADGQRPSNIATVTLLVPASSGEGISHFGTELDWLPMGSIQHFVDGPFAKVSTLLRRVGIDVTNESSETIVTSFVVPGHPGESWPLRFRFLSDAGSFLSEFGIYDLAAVVGIDPVDDKEAYVAAAMNAKRVVFDDVKVNPGSKKTVTLEGGRRFGFYLIPDEGEAFPRFNGNKVPLFSDFRSNPRGYDQFLSFFNDGISLFTWEDLRLDGGSSQNSDRSFADFAFTVDADLRYPEVVANDFELSVPQGEFLARNLVDDVRRVGGGDPLELPGPVYLMVRTLEEPRHGVLLLGLGGTYSYTPHAGYEGEDDFRYSFIDEFGRTSNGSVRLSIIGADMNSDPIALDDLFETQEDAVVVGNLLADNGNGEDSDPDEDQLRVELAPPAVSILGELRIESDGNFRYSPLLNYVGEEHFDYSLLDGRGGVAKGHVVIRMHAVNDDPIAPARAFNVNQGDFVSGNLLDPLNGVLDVDSEMLMVGRNAVNDPGFGSLILNPDGLFTYMPESDFTGTDRFEYRVFDDSGGAAVGVVDIHVTAVNRAPIANDDRVYTNEGLSVSVNILGDNGNGIDSDPDGDPLVIEILEGPVHGRFEVLSRDGMVIYTPDAGFTGEDFVMYSIRDLDGLRDTGRVIINVESVTPVLIARDDVFRGLGGEMITIDVLKDNGFGQDVLGGEDVVVSLLEQPNHGSLEPGILGGFVYEPHLGFEGIDSFRYQLLVGTDISSNIATATIHVESDSSVELVSPNLVYGRDGALYFETRSRLNYTIESSENLENWQATGQVVLGDDGIHRFVVDSESSEHSFFRVRVAAPRADINEGNGILEPVGIPIPSEALLGPISRIGIPWDVTKDTSSPSHGVPGGAWGSVPQIISFANRDGSLDVAWVDARGGSIDFSWLDKWAGIDYDLRFLSEQSLPNHGANLVVIAMIDGRVNVRIFDSFGVRTFDIKEPDLILGRFLDTFRRNVLESGIVPDVTGWSQESKRNWIRRVAIEARIVPIYSPKIIISHIVKEGGEYKPVWHLTPHTIDRLGGFARDQNDNIFYLTTIAEDLQREIEPNGIHRQGIAHLVKLDPNGNEIFRTDLRSDIGSTEATPLYSPMTFGTARIGVGSDKVAITFSSDTEYDYGVSSRHQKHVSFIVDALSGIAESFIDGISHSWDQRLIYDGADFVTTSLGDASLRGIGVAKLGQGSHRVAFAVKGGDASTALYYQNTFTRLGDLEPGSNGYAMLFSSERSEQYTGGPSAVVTSRNLAFVHIRKDFYVDSTNPSNKYDVTIVDTAEWNSAAESFNVKIKDYWGKQYNGTNRGVVWLTQYDDRLTENVERPKLVALDSGYFIALWEKWSLDTYIETFAMVIDEYGNIMKEAASLGDDVRLHRQDSAIRLGNKAAWVVGGATSVPQLILYTVDENLKLERYELE